MSDWIAPWSAKASELPSFRLIVSGLIKDGYDYRKWSEKPVGGERKFDRVCQVLDCLDLCDTVLVATNYDIFQNWLSSLLPIIWALSTGNKVYTTDTPDIVSTLTRLSSWESDFDSEEDRDRLSYYPLLVWNDIESEHKPAVNNSARILSLLRRRAKTSSKVKENTLKTLAIFKYTNKFTFQRMQENLITALGSSLGTFISRDFQVIKAGFKLRDPEVRSL
jgi:hypothetical protein